MKHLIVILSSLLLFSCSKSKEKIHLDMQVLNTEINSVQNFASSNKRNALRFDNYLYDSLLVNKIDVKISNTGNTSYAFFIRRKLDDFDYHRENIKFDIFKGKQIIIPENFSGAINVTGQHPAVKRFRNYNDHDSLEYNFQNNYLKEKVNLRKISYQREMEFIVIHSGESKFFTFYKTLPIFEKFMGDCYVYELNEQDNYFMKLTLKNDSKITRENLTPNQLKEIETNKYVLFNGIIHSNKVPIKFKPLKK